MGTINNLKKLRLANELTQTQLSDLSSISIRAIQNYEAGVREPKIKTAQRIAKALNTTVEEIFELPSKNISD